MNVIVVGAKKDWMIGRCNSSIGNAAEWNNPAQAKHSDLLALKDMMGCDVVCYDIAYPCTTYVDGIKYLNEIFHLDGNGLDKGKLNVVIEFNNMLDENYINHGDGNAQYVNLMMLEELAKENDFKIAVIACGCSWDKGLPLDCVVYVQEKGFYTPVDANNVDNLLYVISSNQCIRLLTEKEQEMLYPYQLGLYQTMGTFMWRGCEADAFRSEVVLRELFCLIGSDCIVGVKNNDLVDFINGKKHWNGIQWHTRKVLSKFVYGI